MALAATATGMILAAVPTTVENGILQALDHHKSFWQLYGIEICMVPPPSPHSLPVCSCITITSFELTPQALNRLLLAP